METCSEDSDFSNDSAFESGVRMNGRSYEVTERKGHSALVPGITATKTPSENTSEQFTKYEPHGIKKLPPIHTEIKVPTGKHSLITATISTTTTSETTQSRGRPVQEMERNGGYQSIPVYSIQADRSQDTDTQSTDDERTALFISSKSFLARKKGLCTKIHFRFFLLMFILILLVLILLVSCGSVLLQSSTNPGPIQKRIDISNLNTVLVDYFNTFLYNQIKVQKAKENHCPDCEVEVYSFYPDHIIVDNKYYNFSSNILTATRDDVLLSPVYFISDSTVELSVTFYPSRDQNTTVEFVLFDNLDLYNPFQNGRRPVPYKMFSVQVSKNKKIFSKSIKIPNTGYFFLGIRPSGSSVTFQYQLNVHQIFYSRDNFPSFTCLLDANTEFCTIPFTTSYTDDYTDTLQTCIFLYSIPPPNFPESYYVTLEYNVQRGFWNFHSIALVSVIGVSTLCVCIFCCSCIWFCLYKCQRKSVY